MIRLRALRPLDVLLVICFAAAMQIEVAARDLPFSVLSSVVFVLASVPVLIRRPAPVLALVLAFAGLFAISETTDKIYSTIPGPAVVCAYALADLRGRRPAVIAAVIGLPIVVFLLQFYSEHPTLGWTTVQNLALVVLPLALGVAAHDRRAYTEALVERARAAERNQEEVARRRVGEERLKIARDVHDVVAHAMVTINVQAGVGAFLVHRDPDEAYTNLRTIKQISGDALDDLRSMLGILRDGESASGTPVQGVAALDDLVDGLRIAGLGLTVDIDPSARSLPASVDSTAFRIVQEAMTNTLRHAGPTTAHIGIRREESLLLIEIEDAGGPSTGKLAESGSGNGLRGMRERVAAIGGSLEAGPRAEGGWQVVASLPLSVTPRPSPTEVSAP